MAILDAGLTTTLSKEFASKKNDNSIKQKLFITLETCYLIIASLIIILFIVFSKSITNHWLKLDNLVPAVVSNYIKIIGIGVAFQLLSNFYMGGLYGLEQQIKANLFQIGLGIVRNGLVIVPLIFSPNLLLFFIWQSSCMIIYALLLRITIQRAVFKEAVGKIFLRIDKSVIRNVWRFAGGIALISMVSALNTQMDKIAISKLLPLEILGYYTLAYSLAQGLIILVNPISAAVLPRFTALFSEDKKDLASDLFQKVFLLSSILVLSFAANLIINSRDLIWIWTGNKQYSVESAFFVPYLAIGMIMLSLQIIPFSVAIANGYTKFINYIGILSLIVTMPGYWMMTKYFGPKGIAIVWCVVQCFIAPSILYVINKKFLHRKLISEIFIKNTLLPALISFLIAGVFAQVSYFHNYRWGMLIWIGFSTGITLLTLLVIFMLKDFKQNLFIFSRFAFKNKNL
jgi:O-antigen/teichoic acid export membrane protein